ncbi:MAG: hypothetical protein P1P77_05090 [Spirochaetaceae bacterium]|nr:hypothetical protein [Spirochaetaceae bacterium]
MRDSVAVDIDFSREARRFFAIQMGRYLLSKSSGRFSEHSEKDAVMGMIKDAWIELRSTGVLNDLSREGREAVYLTTIIVFPSFVADSGLQCVPVDFITGKRVGEQIIAVPSRPSP